MLVPYGTERRLQRAPYVTYGLVAVNCVVFFVIWAMGSDAMWDVFKNYGVVPGALRWYTVVTSLFIHANILHLAGNMLFLWVFGRHVEDALGHKLYAVVYFSSALAAIVLHTGMAYLFARGALDVPAVGASGAISGVLGVFAVRFYKTRIKVLTFVPVRMVTFSVASIIGIGVWIASQVLGGLVSLGASGGVANWAHIGGFFYGMLMAIILRLEAEGHDDYLAEEAEEALRVGNWQGAIERYMPLVADDPENVAAHIGIGTACSMIGDDERSLRHYEEGVRLLCARSEPAQALLVYREMKAAYPDYVPPAKLQYDLGCACEDTDPVQAYEEFDGVCQRHPGSPEAQMALLKMGQLCLTQLGRPGEAMQRFRGFMEQYPDSLWSVAAQDGLRAAQAALDKDRPTYGRPRGPGPVVVPRL